MLNAEQQANLDYVTKAHRYPLTCDFNRAKLIREQKAKVDAYWADQFANNPNLEQQLAAVSAAMQIAMQPLSGRRLSDAEWDYRTGQAGRFIA